MKTVCDSDGIRFEDLGKREVIGKFDGGMIGISEEKTYPSATIVAVP